MKPILDRIIILQDSKDEQTRSGIILAPSAQSHKPTGVVVAVGPRAKDVQARDRVLFNANYHQEFKNPDDGKTYVTINEVDVLAILGEVDVAMRNDDGRAIQVVQ